MSRIPASGHAHLPGRGLGGGGGRRADTSRSGRGKRGLHAPPLSRSRRPPVRDSTASFRRARRRIVRQMVAGVTSFTIHPARWSPDAWPVLGIASPNCGRMARMPRLVKPHHCPAKGLRGVRARRSPPCSRAMSLVSCVRRSDMPHRLLLVLLVPAIAATLNVLTGAAQGQTPAPPPLTYERAITMTWKHPHDKIPEIAKDTVFPDDKLGWKPHPDARSVLDEFRQITMGLEFSAAQLRGEKLDGPGVRARRNADAGKP